MKDPIKKCTTCGRTRNCMLHKRADFPPDAAEKWLKKTCEQKGKCEITYQAGIDIEGIARRLKQ
jgi:hypothetical protein